MNFFCVDDGGKKSEDESDNEVYDLFSVLVHSGGAMGGHYYAYIRNIESGKLHCERLSLSLSLSIYIYLYRNVSIYLSRIFLFRIFLLKTILNFLLEQENGLALMTQM